MRKLLFVFLLFPYGFLFGQVDFWPFGRGYSLEFNVSPPRLGTIPWQSVIPNNPAQLNHSTVYAEDENLKLYFLNGSYYDSLQREIFRVPNYQRNEHNDWSGMIGKNQTLFLRSQDTLYHVFTAGSLYENLNAVPIRRFDFRRFYLSRITQDTGGYQVAIVDSFPRVSDTVTGNFGRNFKVVPIDSLPLGLVLEHRSPSSYSPDAQFNSNAIYVNNGRFESIPIIADYLFQNRLPSNSIFNPLTNSLIALSPDTIIQQYRMVFGNNGLRFTKVDSFAISPYALLGRKSATFYMESMELGPQGRFLFMQVYEDQDRAAYNGRDFRLLRIDLFGRDTLGYRDSVIQLPSANGHFKDMQFGPDSNLYYLWNKQPYIMNSWGYEWRGTHINNRNIGRIANPLALDSSLITSRPEFGRTSPWAAFSMFPDFSADQFFKDGFKLLYACADSVSFRLNFGRELDSVVWNFGDPRLGPANRSTLRDPSVVYPSPGKYLVRLNLWWKGRRLHGLADSIEVHPLVQLDMPRDTILCKGDSIELNFDQGFPAIYQWSTGDTSAAISVKKPGWYRLKVENRCGMLVDSVLVFEVPELRESLKDLTICAEDSAVEVNLPDYPSLFYHWSHGANEASVSLQDTGTYSVVWGSSCDTIRESFHLSKVSCTCELFIPNAFTPNGDGKNDFFDISSACQTLEFKLQIFNRWGQLIYEQDESSRPWDGNFNGAPVQGGVYLYKVSFKGQSEGQKIEGKRSGSIMVMP